MPWILFTQYISGSATLSDKDGAIPGDCEHSWSSSIWEVIGAFMGCQGVAEVHFHCQHLDFILRICNRCCFVLHNTAGDLPVSAQFCSSSPV